MAALADLSALVNRLTGGNSGAPEFILQHKTVRSAGATVTAPVNGKIQSLWTLDGSPSGGVAPGAVAAPTNATAGALKQTDPVGGRQKWLQAAFPTASQNGTLIVYDRILHISGLSGTVITAQTVGGTLTRYTTGAGVFAFIEIYTAVGGTATTITMSYTN